MMVMMMSGSSRLRHEGIAFALLIEALMRCKKLVQKCPIATELFLVILE